MAGLLLSVRNVHEAQIALAEGVDLIDVKEPDRGPLGAARAHVVEEVARTVAGRTPLSVALGELNDWDRSEWADFPSGISFAKFGLAGCARHGDWTQRYSTVVEALPAGVRPVAVIYADWRSAAAPPPEEVVALAVESHCGGVLVDTFDKSRGGLFDWFEPDELRRLSAAVRRRRMLVTMAGSLSAETLPLALALAPDYVAVRGAACRGGRDGPLDAERVRQLLGIVRQPPQSAESFCRTQRA